MLQSIRDRAQGWIAWAIVILISIPFALWGIQEYLGGGSEPVAAEVNGFEITERDLDSEVQNFLREMRARLGKAFNPELFDEQKIRRQVLDSMIERQLINQASQDMGLQAGPALVRTTIASFPAFQKDGQFDKATYEQALRYQGYVAPGQFEERVRSSLISGQLQTAINGTALATEREVEQAVRLLHQQRDIAFLTVPVEQYIDAESVVGEDEIKKYYTANQEQFRTEERVRIEYLVLDAQTLGETIEPSEGELETFFSAHVDQFQQPEQRKASHILVSLDAGADAAAEQVATEKIDAAARRVRSGEDFALVAREVSEDPGSAQAGGDLGLFARGIMDPVFEEAVFAAEVGQVVGPVRSQFGLHLILVTEVQEGGSGELADVREEVVKAYRKNEAEKILYDYAERVADMAYEHPDSLEPIRDALALAVETSDWFGRAGGDGLLAAPKVVGAAFSEEVLVEGQNSDLIELSPERMLVLRVLEHEEAAVRALDEVRGEIVAELRLAHAKRAAQQEGQALLDRLQGGETLDAVASTSGYTLEEPGSIARSDRSAPQEVVRRAFTLPRPDGQTEYGGVQLPSGDYAIIALKTVQDGSLAGLEEPALDQQRSQIENTDGRAYFNELAQYLRAHAEVKIIQQ